MLTRRLQILLDERRYQRLQAEARLRKASVGALVREAIDRTFPVGTARRRAAIRRILAAPRVPIPDVAELKAELEEIRAGAKR